MTIELWSYGCSNGYPSTHFARVWNLESLPNAPPELRRHYNGKNTAVRQAILSTPAAQRVLAQALEAARNNHGSLVRFAFACRCGIHRSVVLVDTLAEQLCQTRRVRVYHRDLYANRKYRRKDRRREISRRAKRRAVLRRYFRSERLRARRHARRNQQTWAQLLMSCVFERGHRR